MKVSIRVDGAFVIGDGRIPGIAIVDPDGSLTIHIPARDVVIESTFDPSSVLDFSDVETTRLAVRKGVATVDAVRAIRPAVADELERSP